MKEDDAHEREALLKAEIARLKERMERTTDFAHEPTPVGRRPTATVLWALVFLLVVVTAGAFFVGYLPRNRREAAVMTEAKAGAAALPVVNVTEVRRAPAKIQLDLPGSTQAVTEAPILARADGYLKRRLADIGDRVTAGQLLAEIEAPELDQQVAQARAALQQTLAAGEQANASLEQAHANEQLARVTAQRWANLLAKGAVSRQEHDVYQAQHQAQSANVRALEKAVAAANSNVEAARANVGRLEQMQGYRHVLAPFDGRITLRNVDAGALITIGQTLLFRIAQTGTLRIYVNVPQSSAESIRAGMPARLTFADLPGRSFAGKVVRTSNALDPSSRTLLTEVHLDNTAGALLPGMYCRVTIEIERVSRPLIVRGDTLIFLPQGPTVATVTDQQTIHFQRVLLGRDFGKELEVLQGLEEGQVLVANPGDQVREGLKVQPVKLKVEER